MPISAKCALIKTVLDLDELRQPASWDALPVRVRTVMSVSNLASDGTGDMENHRRSQTMTKI